MTDARLTVICSVLQSTICSFFIISVYDDGRCEDITTRLGEERMVYDRRMPIEGHHRPRTCVVMREVLAAPIISGGAPELIYISTDVDSCPNENGPGNSSGAIIT